MRSTSYKTGERSIKVPEVSIISHDVIMIVVIIVVTDTTSYLVKKSDIIE